MNLMTRNDLDGVICAVLITTMEKVDRVIFANPEDIEMQIKRVQKGDILANLPYHHNAGMWFDHHDVAQEEPWQLSNVKGLRGNAQSTSRLVLDFYNSSQLKRFEDAVNATDKMDSANLTLNDVTNPEGWILLGFTLDPFMGLKAFTGYANTIIATIKNGADIDSILALDEVKGRINLYKQDERDFRQALRQCSIEDDHILITDFSKLETVPVGNRFNAFMMYPDSTVQLILTFNKDLNMMRVRAGKNIFNRNSKVHLGELFAQFGGGGLDGAAGCQLDLSDADKKVREIITQLKAGEAAA